MRSGPMYTGRSQPGIWQRRLNADEGRSPRRVAADGFADADWYALKQRRPQKSCTTAVLLSDRQVRLSWMSHTTIALDAHRPRLTILQYTVTRTVRWSEGCRVLYRAEECSVPSWRRGALSHRNRRTIRFDPAMPVSCSQDTDTQERPQTTAYRHSC